MPTLCSIQRSIPKMAVSERFQSVISNSIKNMLYGEGIGGEVCISIHETDYSRATLIEVRNVPVLLATHVECAVQAIIEMTIYLHRHPVSVTE